MATVATNSRTSAFTCSWDSSFSSSWSYTSTSSSSNTACRIPLAINCFSFTTSMEVSTSRVARFNSPFSPSKWVILVASSSEISATVVIWLTLAVLSDTPFPTMDRVTRSVSWEAMFGPVIGPYSQSTMCKLTLRCCNPRTLRLKHQFHRQTMTNSSQAQSPNNHSLLVSISTNSISVAHSQLSAQSTTDHQVTTNSNQNH